MTTTAAAEQQIQPEDPPAAEEELCEVHCARQPLLNRDGMLCGYELKVFFPEPKQDDGAAARLDGSANPDPDAIACIQARSLLRMLVQPNVRAALTGHPAYVDVSREMLFDDSMLRCPPSASCSNCRRYPGRRSADCAHRACCTAGAIAS